MLAVRKLTPGPGDPKLAEVDLPEPGPGQARIAVTGCGMCGTDLHLIHAEYAFRAPVTMGHEVAGVVDAVGAGVDDAWIGRLVAPETAFGSCGVCEWCRTGHPMLCAERLSIGSGVDGGFASHMVVPARLLHALPDWLDHHAAALLEPLACVCNALFDPNRIEPGDRVVVSGAGPVGILAAQVVRAAGATPMLVGTATDAGRLAVSRTLGIESVSVDNEADRARLDDEGRARRIDVVVECAGAEAAVVSGLRLVRPRGRYVQIGLLAGLVSVPFGEIVLRELAISGGFGSSPASWFRATRLVERRAVDLLPLVSAVLPLSGWADALDRLVRREGLKSVLDPRLS